MLPGIATATPLLAKSTPALPGSSEVVVTEDGVDIITEDGDTVITEG
jgi:hypothetical protein